MALNLKMNYFHRFLNNLVWNEKSTHPHTDHSQMEELKVFTTFLNCVLAKHISRNREWDDVAPLATTSYNWLPNQHSKESPFFVMFGRDTLTNLKHLISPKLRYMGMEELILDLEIMSYIY